MVAEAKNGWFDFRDSDGHLRSVPLTGITDCKSLYDASNAPRSPSKVEDKRVVIDLSIIRQSMSRTSLQVRWCPTELMVADSLTKDLADPADWMRAMLAHGTYELSRDAEVLALKKDQRARRTSRKSLIPKPLRVTLRPVPPMWRSKHQQTLPSQRLVWKMTVVAATRRHAAQMCGRQKSGADAA